MITSKDVRYEMDEAKKVIVDEKSTVDAKFEALYKLVSVAIKVGLSIRTNTKQIMIATDAKQIEPKKENKE